MNIFKALKHTVELNNNNSKYLLSAVLRTYEDRCCNYPCFTDRKLSDRDAESLVLAPELWLVRIQQLGSRVFGAYQH